jgi:SAM-dependent methyltransferase
VPFDPQSTPEGGLHAAATERNRGPILEVLRRVLPREGVVVEVASGTGQHAAFFASALSHLAWQPTDLDPRHLESIRAWSRVAAAPNLAPPLLLDVEADPWPVSRADAIVNINMIHIAPWSACEALMRGAGRLLRAGGVLYMYGPFKRDGQHTADSNARFDERLRSEDPSWGVRDMSDVVRAAATNDLQLTEVVPMPANNHSLVFRKAVAGRGAQSTSHTAA